MDRPAPPSRNDSLPLLRATVRAGREASLLLGRLPSGRLAPSPSHLIAADPRPLAAPNDGLPLPDPRRSLPRRAALPGLQHLRPSARSRWSLPALRRAGRRQRSAPHRKPRWYTHELTRRPTQRHRLLAALACRAFVPQAWYRKEALPDPTDSPTGRSGHAIIRGLSVALNGDFFLALDRSCPGSRQHRRSARFGGPAWHEDG